MKHAGTAFLVVMLFSTLGLWGIAQQKNGAYATRMREIEARHAKLEEEQRSFASLSEKSQKRIASLETENTALTRAVADLKSVVRERDEIRRQLEIRTVDRDNLRVQLNDRTKERDQISVELRQFTQDLHLLLGRMEGVLATGGPTTASGPTSDGPTNGPTNGSANVEAIPASRSSE